ncbi:MAG: shikimate kinase [Anaerolineae bacterium]
MIILIGPMGAGKSTIGGLLSKRLNLEWVQLDELRWAYYEESGYDKAAAKRMHESGDMAGLAAFWKPLEAYSVERVVVDYSNCVIDFGAGHSVYDDDGLLERVKKALAPYPNVVLLMPTPDVDETLRILNERIPAEVPAESHEIFISMNEHFVKHRSNYELAKVTVYTEGKSPEQTCDEIVGKLK